MPKIKRLSATNADDKAARTVAWIEEGKGRDINVINLRNAVTDVVIIASATSARHAQSLADRILAGCREENFEFFHQEGYQLGDWILIDANDVIVHIFQPAVRDLFALDTLLASSLLQSSESMGLRPKPRQGDNPPAPLSPATA
jgi:ribosome-associated protein